MTSPTETVRLHGTILNFHVLIDVSLIEIALTYFGTDYMLVPFLHSGTLRLQLHIAMCLRVLRDALVPQVE